VLGRDRTNPFLGRDGPNLSWASPAHIFNIYYNIILLEKTKTTQKSFKKNYEFLKCFPANFV